MKKILPITIGLAIANFGFSQVTINGNDINPMVGDAPTTHATTYSSPGAAGANQTWDFSNIVSNGSSTSVYAGSSVNGANISLTSGGNTIHLLNTNTASEYKSIVASGVTITYSDGEKVLQFPLSLNSTFSDTFYATFTSSYPAVRSGSNTLVMDGYGTLILGNQTITDVIRVKFEQDYSDNFDIGGTPYITEYLTEVYIWYKAGTREPLLSMSEINSGGQVSQNASFTGITNVGIESIEGINEVTVLGNPFEGDINFSIDATEQKEITYSVLDITGSNVIKTNNTSISKGDNNLSISMSDQAAGVYCLSITDGSKTINKLVIKK